MNRTQSTLAATVCAALLAFAGASAAVAQPSPAAMAEQAQAATQQTPGARAGHQRMTPEQRQQAMARRAAALHNQLALRAEQQPAWDNFMHAMQPGERPARLERQSLQALSTPERIDRMRALREQRAAETDRRGDAVKAFYAVLDPAQQKTFDAEGTRMFNRFGHGKQGHHGMHGKHHPRGGAPEGHTGMPLPQ